MELAIRFREESETDTIRSNYIWILTGCRVNLSFRYSYWIIISNAHTCSPCWAYAPPTKTADSLRSVLKMVFDSGVLASQCAANPVKSVQRISEKKRDRYISHDEYTWLTEVASPTLSAIVNMAWPAHWRRAENLARIFTRRRRKLIRRWLFGAELG